MIAAQTPSGPLGHLPQRGRIYAEPAKMLPLWGSCRGATEGVFLP